jgi:hypothetical protein
MPIRGQGETYEDTSTVLYERVLNKDGTVLQVADVDSITLRLYRAGDTSTVLHTIPLIVADTIFDTPGTDCEWPDSDNGYTFKYTLPGLCLPDPVRYRAEVTFIPKTGLTGAGYTNAAGTATGGAAGYILLEDNGVQADDAYKGYDIRITGGTGEGLVNRITAYDYTGHGDGNRRAAVSEAWELVPGVVTNPDATSVYIIDCHPFVVAFGIVANRLRGS